eukprot:gene7851-biopygen13620
MPESDAQMPARPESLKEHATAGGAAGAGVQVPHIVGHTLGTPASEQFLFRRRQLGESARPLHDDTGAAVEPAGAGVGT